MKLESVRSLRGINIWSQHPMLEGVFVPETLSLVIATNDLLAAIAAAPNAATRAVLERLRVSIAAAAPDWAAALAGLTWALSPRVPGRFACETVRVLPAMRETQRCFRVAIPYLEESVSTRALEFAQRWLKALARGAALPDLAAEYGELCEMDESVRLGPSTLGIVRAAEKRGIPVKRLNDGSLVQLGHGAEQRRVWAAETDGTSIVAENIAQDKELTKTLLDAANLPVPRGVPVHSRAEVWRAAQRLGLPVVIKPRNGNQGKGVSVGLKTEGAVLEAYDAAAASHDGSVMLERHIEGADFRLLVVGKRLVAAARREVPSVVADGVSTIEQLVAIENQNPLRGEGHATALSKLRLDGIAAEVLASQGLGAHSVPPAGQKVILRRNANLSTGGTATDVTEQVHPDVARAAVEAAQVVGLEIAGIDLVATDVSVPLSVSGGAMVEVNAAPGLRMHLEPSGGTPQPVGEAVIELLFPQAQTGRIPVVAVTGTNGKTTTVRAIAHVLRAQGLRVGMTCTDGVYVEQRRIDTGDCSGPKSAKLVLAHPRVQAAVLETARGGILREGLGFDQCDVAVVTNLAEGDHLGMNFIHSVEQLAHVKGTIVRGVSPKGAAVLNAEDPAVVALAKTCAGEVIYFAKSPHHPVIRRHQSEGGRSVVVHDGKICFFDRSGLYPVARIEDLPLTGAGLFEFQVENLLAVAATAWFYRMPREQVARALATFGSDQGTTPGRMNVLRHLGSTIVLDYGHNSSALVALTAALSKLPSRRRKVVYTAAGDRRDEDIRDQARILADFFDDIFIYEDQCTRGRKDGEIIDLMCEGFRAGTRAHRVLQETSELEAIEAAIRGLAPGDVLLCQVDQVELALEFVSALLLRLENVARPASDERRGSVRPKLASGLHH